MLPWLITTSEPMSFSDMMLTPSLTMPSGAMVISRLPLILSISRSCMMPSPAQREPQFRPSRRRLPTPQK
jgi:hypothetical protein